MCGDLWMYWHIRGKNLTAREYAAAFLDADTGALPTVGRAGALITAGLASWMLGQFERANEEWAEAYRIAAELEADRELCIAAFFHGLGLLGFDLEAGLEWTSESIERSRALGFTWAEGFASTFDGILHAVAGDLDTAQARYSQALEIQQRIGDEEGAGLSLGGLAAAGRRSRRPRRTRSTSTGSRSPRSRRSATAPRRPGSSPRWPGRTSGTATRRSRAGTSSTRCRRTPTWRASAASGSR